ncbi:MAG TPA: MBL fold metallo-hydrolase [Candidatus Brocadiia bacterium]|nr:MBL fold metallo-hydrolase [Candidatus Brocadiia bacterium]
MKTETRTGPELLFLGSGAAMRIPAHFCDCATCEAARGNPALKRTRASAAVIGRETVLIDAGPDMEDQLERAGIRRVDRIFITHWHYDHVAGLGGLRLIASCAKWPPVQVYVPRQAMSHFDRELEYVKPVVNLHPIGPGNAFDLPDGGWEVVKTTHTEESVGFVFKGERSFAYLVDSSVPPEKTAGRLRGLDLLILEATMDERDEARWNFSVPEAVEFWRQTGVPRCILTHLSCHRWIGGSMKAGFTIEERERIARTNPGLECAHDGMRISL